LQFKYNVKVELKLDYICHSYHTDKKARLYNPQCLLLRAHVYVTAETADGLCQRLAGACTRLKPVMYDMSHQTRDRWEIDRRSVIMQQLLGEGMYGQVWQGRRPHTLSIVSLS